MCDCILPQGASVVREPWNSLPARPERQRQMLRLEGVQRALPIEDDSSELHSTLHAADQREGRALHPDDEAPLGLQIRLPNLSDPSRLVAPLGEALQSRATPPGDRKETSDGSAQENSSTSCVGPTPRSTSNEQARRVLAGIMGKSKLGQRSFAALDNSRPLRTVRPGRLRSNLRLFSRGCIRP